MTYQYDRRKTAASEIERDALPLPQKRFVEEIESKLHWDAQQCWEGLHGYIVDFDTNLPSSFRVMKDELKLLVKNPEFRHLTVSDRSVSVGM